MNHCKLNHNIVLSADGMEYLCCECLNGLCALLWLVCVWTVWCLILICMFYFTCTFTFLEYVYAASIEYSVGLNNRFWFNERIAINDAELNRKFTQHFTRLSHSTFQ